MKMAPIPPAMPPAIAPAFELCPPTGVGVAVFDVAVLDTAVLDVAKVEVERAELAERDELLGPSIEPGPSSGEFIKVRRGCHGETERGKDTRGCSHHRREPIEPIWLSSNRSHSGTRCEYVIREESLETNCDVEKSPLGNTYCCRDGVWESAGRRQCQIQ